MVVRLQLLCLTQCVSGVNWVNLLLLRVRISLVSLSVAGQSMLRGVVAIEGIMLLLLRRQLRERMLLLLLLLLLLRSCNGVNRNLLRV